MYSNNYGNTINFLLRKYIHYTTYNINGGTMAFAKTSLSVSKPKVTQLEKEFKVGEEKNGMFWDGEKWVSKEEFQELRKSNG